MQGKFKTVDKAVAQVGFNPSNADRFRLGGIFSVECLDKNGKLKWSEKVSNFVTNEGINSLLNVYFHGATQINPHYVGLAGVGQKAITDSLSSHASWSEISDYADSTARPEFIEVESTAKSISNTGNAASFAINSDATVAGAFICSVVSGTSPGVLFCVADFSSQRVVADGDTMNCIYTISALDS